MIDALTFDEDTHTYRMGERIVPSVTQILADLGFINTDFFDDASADRGRKVHKLTELWDQEALDEDSVDPRLKGYLDAWISFVRKEGFAWIAIEKRIFHPTYWYAGTLDRKGVNQRGKTILLDIKTGVPSKWHSFQLGGYLLCEPADEIWTVHLKKDGRFSVEYHKKDESIADWKAIAWTFRLREGL